MDPSSLHAYRVLLFAGLADQCGAASLEVMAPNPCSVADLQQAAIEQVPSLAQAVFRVAVDSAYAEGDFAITPQVEVAFLPPVSGG